MNARLIDSAFGLTLRSNLPIPELPQANQTDARADVDVHLNLSPLGTCVLRLRSGGAYLRQSLPG